MYPQTQVKITHFVEKNDPDKSFFDISLITRAKILPKDVNLLEKDNNNFFEFGTALKDSKLDLKFFIFRFETFQN